MFLLDRLVYTTSQPDEVDAQLRKRGYTLAASGQSFPGVATRIYPFPGGGFLEVAYITDETLARSNEGGQSVHTFLQEHTGGFTTLVLETDDLERVSRILQAEDYPVAVTPVQEVTDPSGETIRFQMLGTFPHLPWFIRYEKPHVATVGFPQAAIIRTTTFTADVQILEKILDRQATTVNYPNTTAAVLPLGNATLRVESANAYGFGYFEPAGLLLDTNEFPAQAKKELH